MYFLRLFMPLPVSCKYQRSLIFSINQFLKQFQKFWNFFSFYDFFDIWLLSIIISVFLLNGICFFTNYHLNLPLMFFGFCKVKFESRKVFNDSYTEFQNNEIIPNVFFPFHTFLYSLKCLYSIIYISYFLDMYN